MTTANDAQIEYWNGRAGEKWAELQGGVDLMLAHCTARLKAQAGSVAGLRLLDIGCGTGETCAMWFEAGARVTGVDVSAPMLAVATERLSGRVTLIQADAATWRDGSPFDMAVSRFGVMFFVEPDAAFANIAANVRPGGRLLFCCWRTMDDNQWVSIPMGAVRDLFSAPPPPGPHAPGGFAFADAARVEGILQRAGFIDIAINRFDFPVCLGSVDDAAAMLVQIGPTAGALAEVDKTVRRTAVERIKAALAVHVSDGSVTIAGSVWLVEATCARGA